MAIGLGIVLIAAALILLLGVLAVVLPLVVNQQRTRHTVVEERR